MARQHEEEPVPSISELRNWVTRARPRIGTGWSALDEVTEGIPVGQTTAVHAPHKLRMQILARTAAWAAGEGFSTVIASRALSTQELWLAVGAGGVGLPPDALLKDRRHDAWIDDRLRVLDLRVLGDHNAPDKLGTALAERTPALLIIDDFVTHDHEWKDALGAPTHGLDFNGMPRQMGCAMVLGAASMEFFTDWLEAGVLTVRVVPDDDGSSTRLTCYDGRIRRTRVVPLREGYLAPPRPGLPLLRRPGVVNIWQEDTGQDVYAFARALGVDATELVWEEASDEPQE